MTYARFVALRQGRWDEFERRLEIARASPRQLGYQGLEALALQYRQILHDHALASARHPGTGAARRLARLAVQGAHALQWDSSRAWPSPADFLLRVFPAAFRRQSGSMLVCAALFVTAALFGWSLVLAQPATTLALVGPEAVQGMKQGRLWTESLMSVVPGAVASSVIATNNMAVALTGWAGGALFGLGALHVVLFNGFHLGAICAATSHYGLLGALLEFVSAHGPLEISLILVTAGSGLAMGRALVAADDRPRRTVLTETGRDSVTVLAGCLPWFALLAVVESYISPSPAVSPALKGVLGLALLAGFGLLAVRPPAEVPRA